MTVDKYLLRALGLSLLLASCKKTEQTGQSHPTNSHSSEKEHFCCEPYCFKIRTQPADEAHIDSISRGRVLGHAARVLEIPFHSLQEIIKVVPHENEGIYNVIVDVNDERLARKIGSVVNDSYEKFAIQAQEDHRAINLNR